MADPFRQFFLDTVEGIVQSEPTIESLHNLLKTVSPKLSIKEVINSKAKSKTNNPKNSNSDVCAKALKILKLRIHPDKHPKDARVTHLFQEVQNFYDACTSTAIIDNIHDEYEQRQHGQSHQRYSRGSNKRHKSSSYPHFKGGDCDDNDSTFTENHQQLLARYPLVFNVVTKSPHVCLDVPKPPLSPPATTSSPTTSTNKDTVVLTPKTLPALLAYRCINARGALAHGKKITRGFTWKDVENQSISNINNDGGCASIRSIFDLYGGYKELRTVQEIKEELLNNGPIISVSFYLSEAYLKHVLTNSVSDSDTSTNGANLDNDTNAISGGAFVKECVGETHPLLIVGWALTSFGEMWQVQPLTKNTITPIADFASSSKNAESSSISSSYVPIGFNQFGIDNLCLAPKSKFENIPWQPGPYFDTDFQDAPDWREWSEMDLPLSSHELEMLAKCFGDKGFFHSISSGKNFVIRDRSRMAHSECYCLKEVRWDENTNEWIATVHLVRKTT